MTSALNRRAKAAVVAVAATVALSGCSALDGFGGRPEPSAAATPTPAPTPTFESQFTRDGTFQSHVDIDGVDFVYNMYPTKATPRTNEWFPAGNKYFSFTFGAYDLDQELRDPFKTKRKVYLDRIEVESVTTAPSGAVQNPYTLDEKAKTITF
ncbi:MAG: hypothetical protein ABW075_11235, partial [Aeromicrobium sp.]